MKRYSKELKKKRFEKKVKKFLFFYFFPIFIIFIIFIFFFNSEIMSIKKINLRFDNKKSVYLEKEKIIEKIKEILGGKYYSIFSKNNYIFFPETEIKQKINSEFSEINNLEIKWGDFLEDIKINVKEESKKYIYCYNFSEKNCFFVSDQGKIFYKISNKISEKKYFILISKNEKKIGDYFFNSQEQKKKIFSLIKKIENKNKIRIKYLFKENKYLNYFITETGTKIIFNNDFNQENILLKFNRVLNKGDFKIEDGVFKKDIIYIDLTLKNRISYCLKGDLCENNYLIK